ncbi:hypothetical protein [Thalassotalea sp. PLHSN55]|uniref:hypothetical protein n=1 Tax=Thalassotalea sp. PLHSN55 TaxID=3435888 RepID=UPI003F8607D1
MSSTAHGSYSIEKKGSILFIAAKSPFHDTQVIEQYSQDMIKATQLFNNEPWASLVTYSGAGVFSPEAEREIVNVTKYRMEHGMIANASVIQNCPQADLQQMQLKRIYQSVNLTFHVFSDPYSAQEWLDEFLLEHKQRKIN